VPEQPPAGRTREDREIAGDAVAHECGENAGGGGVPGKWGNSNPIAPRDSLREMLREQLPEEPVPHSAARHQGLALTGRDRQKVSNCIHDGAGSQVRRGAKQIG
jgi:hypothetical protein